MTLLIAGLLFSVVYGMPYTFANDFGEQYPNAVKTFDAIKLYGAMVIWPLLTLLSLATVIIAFTTMINFAWDGISTTNPSTQVWPGIVGIAMLIVCAYFTVGQFAYPAAPELRELNAVAKKLSAQDSNVQSQLYPNFRIKLPASYLHEDKEDVRWQKLVESEAKAENIVVEIDCIDSITTESDSGNQCLVKTLIVYKAKGTGTLENWYIRTPMNARDTAKWAVMTKDRLSQSLKDKYSTTPAEDEGPRVEPVRVSPKGRVPASEPAKK
jgi:hypothetical protein